MSGPIREEIDKAQVAPKTNMFVPRALLPWVLFWDPSESSCVSDPKVALTAKPGHRGRADAGIGHLRVHLCASH